MNRINKHSAISLKNGEKRKSLPIIIFHQNSFRFPIIKFYLLSEDHEKKEKTLLNFI